MATATEQVRLLIADTTVPYHYTDAQILIFLDLAANDVFIAAALALEAWAGEVSAQMVAEKIGDYSYQRKEVERKLALAARYREQAESSPELDWAEMALEDIGEYVEDTDD